MIIKFVLNVNKINYIQNLIKILQKSGLDSYCKQCSYEIFINNIDAVIKERLRNRLYHALKG